MRRVCVLILMLLLFVVQTISAQIRIIPQEKVQEAAVPQTIESPLRFVFERVNFGTIDEMSGVWQGSVELANRGLDTVVLTQVKSTCGCLKAEPAKRLLAPKERVSVALKYYPRGHAGDVAQRVFLYTNASSQRPSAVLRVEGKVTASADRSDDYPYMRGVLRLRQEVLRFDGGEREVVRVACMNGGSTTIRPTVDSLLSTKGLKVRFEPSTLAPKQEGDMVVEYDGRECDGNTATAKIYLKGVGVPPRHGVVEVRIGDKER